MSIKRWFKRILFGFLGLIAVGIIVLFATGNSYVFRAIPLVYFKGHDTANIDDYVDFPNDTIKAGTPQLWAHHELYNQIPLTDTLKSELARYQTIGFFVAKDGKALLEHYWLGYSDKSHTNSFSMAKTVVTMLLGKAIEQGYIQSMDQPITDFLPEYKDQPFARECTIGDLSAMTSGFDWDENYYFPINPTARAYYGRHLVKQMLTRKFNEKPGGHFKYASADTQLLAIILERALKRKISDYLQTEFWQPMGMEHNAYWSEDMKGGIEKAYCCLNSNVRDFGKLGQLLLQNGQWRGKPILDSSFVAKMITPNSKAFRKGEAQVYGYSLWTDDRHQPKFYAMLGFLGQRVIVVPSEKLVIVRLGREEDTREVKGRSLPNDTYYYVDEVMKMLKSRNLLKNQKTGI